jgi:hypothetical protein
MDGDQYTKSERIKLAAIRRVFGTSDGKVLMTFLEDQYENHKLLGNTPEDTAHNIGQRNVVRTIKALLEHREEVDNE